MDKITGYKLSDGTFVEDEAKAMELQHQLNIKDALLYLCNKHLEYKVNYGDYDGTDIARTLYDFRQEFLAALSGDIVLAALNRKK